MRFIKLTSIDSNEVYIDADSIVAVVGLRAGSIVFAVNMTEKGFEYRVSEEPYEVIDLINELRKEHM